jgi:hypothetical protein
MSLAKTYMEKRQPLKQIVAGETGYLHAEDGN